MTLDTDAARQAITQSLINGGGALADAKTAKLMDEIAFYKERCEILRRESIHRAEALIELSGKLVEADLVIIKMRDALKAALPYVHADWVKRQVLDALEADRPGAIEDELNRINA